MSHFISVKTDTLCAVIVCHKEWNNMHAMLNCVHTACLQMCAACGNMQHVCITGRPGSIEKGFP